MSKRQIGARGRVAANAARGFAAVLLAFLFATLAGCSAPWSHSDAASDAAVPSTAAAQSSEGATAGSSTDGPTASTASQTQTFTDDVFLTGDFLLHSTVWQDAQQADGSYDFTHMMSGIGDLAQGYDLKYYNQESILGGTAMGLSSYPTFNSPQEAGDAMVAQGFNLVSTANNHSLDKGAAGITSSLAYWKQQEQQHGVHTAGTYLSWDDQRAIPVYEKNGITYTFLSWTYGCNGIVAPAGQEYLVNVYPGRVDELLGQIRQAKAASDVVIVAMHWGTEYTFDPTAEQQTLAQQMADAGADIIVGNHPHVIQPVQRIGKAVCFYAMGNLMSGQEGEERLIGMAGGVTVTKTVTGSNSSVSIGNVRADLLYTYHDASYHDYQVIPFDRLDDAHLPGYQQIYQRYAPIITSLDTSIAVGGVRKQ